MKNFLVQPMFPDDPNEILGDLSAELLSKSAYLSGSMRPQTQQSVSELVRTMNCYYSNLIEGHRTTPREIDAALQDSYSDDPKKKDLQIEARHHISTQKKIDSGELSTDNPAAGAYITGLHYDFCNGMPNNMLVITNPDTGKK